MQFKARRRAIGWSVLALCVGVLLMPGSAVAAATTTITSTQSDLCLEVPGGSPSVNTVLQTVACDAGTDESFRFIPVKNQAATYRIRNLASGKCASDYRQEVRQTSCVNRTADPQYGEWTLETVNAARQTYRIVDTETLGTNPICMTFFGSGGSVDLDPCTTGQDQIARVPEVS